MFTQEQIKEMYETAKQMEQEINQELSSLEAQIIIEPDLEPTTEQAQLHGALMSMSLDLEDLLSNLSLMETHK